MSNNIKETADMLCVVPRQDSLAEDLAPIARKHRGDAQLAPIWAEKLRHTYSKVMETIYPELEAASGSVLPVDSSIDPAALEYEYFKIDSVGFASFIDDDGKLMNTGALQMSRYTGKCREIGYRYDVNQFDLERASSAGLALVNLHGKQAKRAHDALTNWVWLFGDSERGLPGLCNHPNITVQVAALNGGSTSRQWANKTADEIATDVSRMINSIAQNTLEAYHAATVFLPHDLLRRMRDLRISTGGDGYASVLGWMQDRFSGDPVTGQGRVEFRSLLMADADRRLDPRTGTNTSGISGDFAIVLPKASSDELCFLRARPFTQLAPQDEDFSMKYLTHSKIGGVKCQIPLAVTRFDFTTT
jgi:hypothetical protein